MDQLELIPDYPEAKLIRTLGYGYIGTTYLTEINSEQFVTKLEKFDGDMTLSGAYARQIAFDRAVAKNHPDVFMTISSIKLVKNSKHIQKVPTKPGFDEKVSAIVNARKHAFIFNYLPLLDGTYASVKDILTPKQELSMLWQITYGINAMASAGFRHRDISARNIMYKKIDDEFKWYIIDYGSVWHDSFIPNEVDPYYEKHRQNDIVAAVLMVTKNVLYGRPGLSLPKFYQLASMIKRHPIYQHISKYLPDTRDDKTAVLATEIYDNETYARICVGHRPAADMIVVQPNKNTLLFMLKHSLDREYSAILEYIDKALKV